MGPPLSDSASRKSPKLDIRSFVKYMKNIGRAYRKQATELVSICRTFVTAQEQTASSYNQLRSALQVVDEALNSASLASKTSRDADDKFDKAIMVLGSYERKFHSRETIAERMAAAKAKDKSSSTILGNVLKKLSLKATEDEPPEPTTVVEFLLLKCLPDDSPIVVRQVLSPKSSLQEILWNFSRFKDKRRLTLKQNPHFYKVSDLPTSREAYIGEFETKPINENFQYAKICVLTDNPATAGRVFLETAEKKRAFGNTWVPKNAIIFKDVCGKLEGENIVGADIQDTSDLWYFEEPLQSPTSPSMSSPNRNGLSPTITPTPTNFEDGIRMQRIQDWRECREPIRRMMRSQDVNIRITAKPRSTSPTPSAPSSPIPSPNPNSSDDSLLSIVLPHPRPSITLQIPAPSTRPLSAGYITARDTPLSKRSSIAGLPPLSPTPPPASPLQPTSAVAPPPSATPLPGPIPHTPTPTVALPLSDPAVPAPPIPDVPQGREAALPEAQILSRAPIAGYSSPGPNVTITEPLHIISVSHGQGNEDGHVTPPAPVPDPQREVSTPNQGGRGPPPSDLRAQHPVQTEVADSQPQPRTQKRNWFQKFVWDYKKDKKG